MTHIDVPQFVTRQRSDNRERQQLACKRIFGTLPDVPGDRGMRYGAVVKVGGLKAWAQVAAGRL